MVNIEENIKNAEQEFIGKCNELKVSTWGAELMHENIDFPYKIGVSSLSNLLSEKKKILLKNAVEIADKYYLKAIYSELYIGINGADILYVGFKEI